jgi:hypothetical protein
MLGGAGAPASALVGALLLGSGSAAAGGAGLLGGGSGPGARGAGRRRLSSSTEQLQADREGAY